MLTTMDEIYLHFQNKMEIELNEENKDKINRLINDLKFKDLIIKYYNNVRNSFDINMLLEVYPKYTIRPDRKKVLLHKHISIIQQHINQMFLNEYEYIRFINQTRSYVKEQMNLHEGQYLKELYNYVVNSNKIWESYPENDEELEIKDRTRWLN